MSSYSKERTIQLQIAGMTCASCELLLERELKAVLGVTSADLNYRKGIALITAQANRFPSRERIADVVKKAGYAVIDGDAPFVSKSKHKWIEIGVALVVIFALYKLLQTFDLVSLAPSTSGALSIGGIFLIGLVAGTSSCLAVTGGLLIALAAKHNEMHRAEAAWRKFRPLLHFNVGRLISYFILGGLVGVLGQSMTFSAKMSGYMNIVVAFIMLWLALSILEIIPKGSFPIRPPKKLSRWIANLSESHHPAAPFALGAFTFFLPCGFTQSLQFVALASGSFVTGAVIMFVFALGTLPSLIGLSAIASTARGTASRLFLRFSGALVLVLALSNLNSGFALTGVNVDSILQSPTLAVGSIATMNGDTQEISMAVGPGYYQPNAFTVKAGVPLRWMIDGTGVEGCTSVLVVPELNVEKPLKSGLNIVEFTPPRRGRIAFSCSMGMVRGTLNVI